MRNSEREVVIWIPGTPVPQGSKTAKIINGKPIMFEANKNLAAWRKTIVKAVQDTFGSVVLLPGYDGFTVNIHFYFLRPKTKSHLIPMIVRPDIDKLGRAMLDGITEAGLIGDDAYIDELHLWKTYVDDETKTGAQVSIWW